MMKASLLLLIAAASLATAARGDEAAVRATLLKSFPQGEIQAISKTPVPGVLEAAVENQIIYISEDGQYILAGPLIDVKTNRNLTETRLEELNAIPFDSLPLEWAFKRVKGTGARKVAIFEDPDCPYCKTLEQTLKGIDDLTVYVFLYPVAQIHPGAVDKSKAVWCSKDRAKAWDEVIRTGTVPAAATDCEHPLAKIAAFAKRHRITATPTTILQDGRRLVGALDVRRAGPARLE